MLELRRDHADGSASDRELAVLADHLAAFHVFDGRLGHARIDAVEQHGLVIAFCAEGERRHRRHQPGARRHLQKSPPVETCAQHVAAARACGRMDNGGNSHGTPPRCSYERTAIIAGAAQGGQTARAVFRGLLAGPDDARDKHHV
jgi:hypothetical protein